MTMADRCVYFLSLGSLLLFFITQVKGLGCFQCLSVNQTNPECEDTFNNTGSYYVPDCWGTRKDRKGMFPGTQCIKLIIEDDGEGPTWVYRTCVVDSGGINEESEIGRLTHCGWLRTINFKNKRRRGCILACNTDGCNTAAILGNNPWVMCACVVLYAILNTFTFGFSPSFWRRKL